MTIAWLAIAILEEILMERDNMGTGRWQGCEVSKEQKSQDSEVVET